MAIAAVLVVLAGVGVALGLTLPTKSLEIEGEVVLIRGETYVGGFTVKRTNKAGLVHREAVLADMLEGLDTSEAGVKECTVSYRGKSIPATVKVLGEEDVEIRIREGTFPTEFEPNAPFPTTGVFDLYYNGELFRSAPITRSSAPGFSSRLSGNYEIFLNYKGRLIQYFYTITQRIASIQTSGILLAEQGAFLDKNNVLGALEILITYNDGTTETKSFYNSDILLSTSEIEEQNSIYETEIVLIYRGMEFTCPVEAYPKGTQYVVKTLSLSSDRQAFLLGETLDVSLFTVSVEYASFSGVITMPLSDEMIVGGIPVFSEAGQYDLTINYKGAVATLPLRVIDEESANTVTALSTAWKGTPLGLPTRGEDLDFTGATFLAVYGYGYRSEQLPLTAELVTGFDKDVSGAQTLVLSYKGFSIEINVLVKDPGLSDVATEIVSVDNWEDRTFFSSDELVISSEASLYVSYGYGYRFDRIPLSGSLVSNNFVPGQVGRQIVTFSYAGLTIDQIVDVKDNRIEGLTGVSLPSWVRLEPAEELDLRSISVILNYSNGYRTETITLAEAVTLGAEYWFVTDFYPEIPDTYYMAVSMAGFTSGNMAVIVKGPVAGRISVETVQEGLVYSVGESIDPSQVHLFMNYSDGSKTEIPFSAGMVEGFDSSTPGSYTKRVIYITPDRSHRRFECAFNYRVV